MSDHEYLETLVDADCRHVIVFEVQTHVSVLVRCAYFMVNTLVPVELTVAAFKLSLPMASAEIVLWIGDMQLCMHELPLTWYIGMGPSVIVALPRKVKAFVLTVCVESDAFQVVVQDEWRISFLRQQVAYNLGFSPDAIVLMLADRFLPLHCRCSVFRGARRVVVFLRHGIRSAQNHVSCSSTLMT